MTYGITLGVAFAADLVTMYVFFEMLTLVTIPLVAHYQDHDSLYAGRLYAAYTIGGASLAFIAVIIATVDGGSSFVYGGVLGGVFDPELLRIAFLFGFFGFGAKAAIFPLFRWLPVAGVAPTPVTALLHAVAVVNSGVFAVMRLTWYAFGPDVIRGTYVQTVCLVTAAFTLLFGAVMAVRQRHFKRRLAYSTVSNLSYMIFGIMLLTPDGLTAGLAHMLFHGIIKITLFMCAGAFMHVTKNEYIYELNGVGRKMPWTFGFYTLGALSLTGIPLFCGFVSKLRLVLAGAAEGSTAAVMGTAALILSAFLCAIYTISVSVRAFFPVRGTERYTGGVSDADLRMLVPIGVFSVINVLFGLFPGPVIGFLEKIAAGLI
jgi:multicomponent Na+:H+ antiporter subunit D